MLDASKYAQHFPDEVSDESQFYEGQVSEMPGARPASAPIAPSPALLAALHQLEREFKQILRAQQPEHTERSE